jgi:glycosyltransferase involved in cell wall biosynthesis
MFWNYNEADILPYTLEAAMPHVDSLFIADDESTDASWAIIEAFKLRYPDKIEYVRRERKPGDKGQRQALLNEIRRRYKPEETWVQTIESDIMILDTDVRWAIENKSRHDVGVSWQLLNAIRKEWPSDIDAYPDWPHPIQLVMPYAHRMEHMLYTFRPLPDLKYDGYMWRPWPSGFGKYVKGQKLKVDERTEDAPLLAHYGYRGPTHFYQKYKKHGSHHPRYKDWDLTSVETIKKTVPFFNGKWNRCRWEMSREGWIKWRRGRKKSRA